MNIPESITNPELMKYMYSNDNDKRVAGLKHPKAPIVPLLQALESARRKGDLETEIAILSNPKFTKVFNNCYKRIIAKLLEEDPENNVIKDVAGANKITFEDVIAEISMDDM